MIFEQASGCRLHRNRETMKVKLMPLGGWHGKLRQQDLPDQCQHIAVTDQLDMLGMPLLATIRKTIKASGDELQEKVKKLAGSWLIRFMCITQRPWSVNSYLLPKGYHKCHCIPLRECDIKEVKKQINRFVYCDQAEKPGELVEVRGRENGGLGLHDFRNKGKAMLCRAFMETAADPKYKHSVFQQAIYQAHILENNEIIAPALPPYYNESFIADIKEAKAENLPIETMSSKAWYTFFLSKNITEENVLQPDGSQTKMKIKCKAEIRAPNFDWDKIWSRSRMRGIMNESRSFFWRLFHSLLPTQKNLHKTSRRIQSPNCILCDANVPDDI